MFILFQMCFSKYLTTIIIMNFFLMILVNWVAVLCKSFELKPWKKLIFLILVICHVSETSYLMSIYSQAVISKKPCHQINTRGLLFITREDFNNGNINESTLAWTLIAPHIQNWAAECTEGVFQDVYHIRCTTNEIKIEISPTRLSTMHH